MAGHSKNRGKNRSQTLHQGRESRRISVQDRWNRRRWKTPFWASGDACSATRGANCGATRGRNRGDCGHWFKLAFHHSLFFRLLWETEGGDGDARYGLVLIFNMRASDDSGGQKGSNESKSVMHCR